jgi:ribosomal protein L2
MIDQPNSAPIKYDRLMQANLARVFGERDAERRLKAIRELYAGDAIPYGRMPQPRAIPRSGKR